MKLEDKNSVEITVPPKARLIWGGLIFVIGFLSPLLIPWVISLDLSAGTTSLISGILALGVPELFMLIAVGILGKSGFDYLKQRLFSFLKKHGPADEVGPLRYKIGLLLFCLPFLIGLAWPYVSHYLPFAIQHSVWIHIGSDVMLFSSLLILGGNFWDKLRSLFVYKSRVVFINNQQQNNNKLS